MKDKTITEVDKNIEQSDTDSQKGLLLSLLETPAVVPKTRLYEDSSESFTVKWTPASWSLFFNQVESRDSWQLSLLIDSNDSVWGLQG